MFCDDLRTRSTFATARTQYDNNFIKLTDLIFNKVTYRIDFHTLGAPTKTAGWSRITFPQQIDPEGFIRFRRYRVLSDRQAVTLCPHLNLQHRFLNQIHDYRRFNKRIG